MHGSPSWNYMVVTVIQLFLLERHISKYVSSFRTTEFGKTFQLKVLKEKVILSPILLI